MKTLLACLALATIVPATAAAETTTPPDVQKFIDQRTQCDHKRGQLLDQNEQQQCKGSDKALLRLKKKYANNAAVMQRLGGFRSDTEMTYVAAGSVRKTKTNKKASP